MNLPIYPAVHFVLEDLQVKIGDHCNIGLFAPLETCKEFASTMITKLPAIKFEKLPFRLRIGHSVTVQMFTPLIRLDNLRGYRFNYVIIIGKIDKKVLDIAHTRVYNGSSVEKVKHFYRNL